MPCLAVYVINIFMITCFLFGDKGLLADVGCPNMKSLVMSLSPIFGTVVPGSGLLHLCIISSNMRIVIEVYR